MPELIIEQVCIYELPTVDTKHNYHGAEVTIGDLHGNAMKLIFMLIKHGIATGFTEENYRELIRIYTAPVDNLSAEDLKSFNDILNKINFNNKIAIRLIGDELADRGSNDYFTLKILEKLHQEAVPVEILISNHSIEFVQAYLNQDTFAPPMLAPGGKFTPKYAYGSFAPSLENLQKLIDKGLVKREEILKITKETYIPTLKAISLDEDGGITIYSHAPIGLQNIKAAAEQLQVPYTDGTPQDLAKTIDAINVAFHEKIKDGTFINNLYESKAMEASYTARRDYESPEPLVALMWNRAYDALERPEIHHGFPLRFCHGHDKSRASPENVHNLDNNLGKSIKHDVSGDYTVLYAQTSRITAIPIVPKTEEAVAAKAKKEQKTQAKEAEKETQKIEAEAPVKAAEEAAKKAQQDADAERKHLERAPAKAKETEEKASAEAVRLKAEKEAADKRTAEEAEKAKKETEETTTKTKVKETQSKAEKKANAIEKAETSFSINLDRILKKAQDLKERGHDHASHTAFTLYNTIRDQHQTFSHSAKKPADVFTFEKECLDALQKARPELEKHRGWKEVLYNIMLAIIGIGFIYGIAVAWNGGLFRLKTDSHLKLDELDKYRKEFIAATKQQRHN